jgi:hypothetical protein
MTHCGVAAARHYANSHLRAIRARFGSLNSIRACAVMPCFSSGARGRLDGHNGQPQSKPCAVGARRFESSTQRSASTSLPPGRYNKHPTGYLPIAIHRYNTGASREVLHGQRTDYRTTPIYSMAGRGIFDNERLRTGRRHRGCAVRSDSECLCNFRGIESGPRGHNLTEGPVPCLNGPSNTARPLGAIIGHDPIRVPRFVDGWPRSWHPQ